MQRVQKFNLHRVARSAARSNDYMAHALIEIGDATGKYDWFLDEYLELYRRAKQSTLTFGEWIGSEINALPDIR